MEKRRYVLGGGEQPKSVYTPIIRKKRCAYSLRKLGETVWRASLWPRGFLYSREVVQVHNKNLKTHFWKLTKREQSFFWSRL